MLTVVTRAFGPALRQTREEETEKLLAQLARASSRWDGRADCGHARRAFVLTTDRGLVMPARLQRPGGRRDGSSQTVRP